uniref:Remorin C-terminal domain-containing protein n=1 Tax=Kalanchoe fedtschenkoi TaxID=63787 RepID=A0A7N0TDY6_KALFE
MNGNPQDVQPVVYLATKLISAEAAASNKDTDENVQLIPPQNEYATISPTPAINTANNTDSGQKADIGATESPPSSKSISTNATKSPQFSPTPSVVPDSQTAIPFIDPPNSGQHPDDDGFSPAIKRKGRARGTKNQPKKILPRAMTLRSDETQEIKLSPPSFELVKKRFSYNGSWTFLNSHNRLLIGWNTSSILSCQVISSSPQYAHCFIQTASQNFYATFIYAYNQVPSRTTLWSDLSIIATSMSHPWTLLGDFNCLLHTDDRFGRSVSLNEVAELSHFCQRCNLSDIPYTGHKFTWSNKRDGSASVLCKLDRILCNDLWMASFPTSHATFCSPGVSDHCPGILKIPDASSVANPKRRFKFCNAWTLHVTAWQNLQKAKTEAAVRKLEMKLERKRSESMDKIIKKFKKAEKQSQKMRRLLAEEKARSAHHDEAPKWSLRVSPSPVSIHVGSFSCCFTCHALEW